MLHEPRRALVDVDGILWDFHSPIRRYLHEHFDVPDQLPTHWDWYKDVGLDDKQFGEAINAVHTSQARMPGAHPPIPGAQEMLLKLKQLGYETIIASHRRAVGADQLVKWLLEWELVPFAGVYCGMNKHFLIDAEQGVVIDDAPMTIIEGALLGCQVRTLAYPWNEVEKVSGGMYVGMYTRYPDLVELTGALK